MRQYTALQEGKVVRRGTFSDEDLLRQDFPEGEYTLLLDEYLDFEPAVVSYIEMRAMEYPPLQDFADAMFWQAQGDDSKMVAYFAKCAAVKAKYPKPV